MVVMNNLFHPTIMLICAHMQVGHVRHIFLSTETREIPGEFKLSEAIVTCRGLGQFTP